MKYKLIKEYPGSPKLGYITIPKSDDAYYVNSNWIQPENYPEFWEPVVEKDYEILSYIGIHKILKGKTYTKEKYGYEFHLYEDKHHKNLITIHSIKRLSDGEIFTIGDKLETGIIKKFYLPDVIQKEITIYVTEDDEDTYLSEAVKLKQPLFTTEDGVDIFKNINKYYTPIYIIDKALNIRYCEKDFNTKPSNNVKYFYSKEKAEEYILMNKPILSLKEIYDLTDKNSGQYNESDLEKLVKQKLNK